MSIKKLLCLVLALTLCIATGLAETTDLQAELDAANARIAELEALIDTYKPYYDATIAVEYDGGIVTVEEAMEVYNGLAAMYSQYGIDLAQYGMEDQIKQSAVDDVMTDAVLRLKAEEMGILPLSEDAAANLQAEAESSLESYVEGYINYYYSDSETEITDEQRAQIRNDMANYGYTIEEIYADLEANYIHDEIYNSVIADITIDENDIQATYDAMIEDAKTNYESESSYVNDVNSGSPVVYHPEGYRMIKQILVKFDDDQSARYSDLKSTLASLNSELTAATAPAEEATEETAEEATEETTEETAPRAIEEIQADIDACNADMDALYAELMPEVNEVVEAFNNGTDIETLIAEHNDDTGMPANGYPVKADSIMWDPAFANAAMAIPEVGQIGEPASGTYGIYITYYAGDVTPGAVALEEIRETVEEQSLSDKQSDTYDAAVTEWTKALNPIYHYENLK